MLRIILSVDYILTIILKYMSKNGIYILVYGCLLFSSIGMEQ